MSGSICAGEITIEAGNDGIQSNNDEDSSKGWIVIDGGTFSITSDHDGIQAETSLVISGGEFTLLAGGGSVNAESHTETGFGMGNNRFSRDSSAQPAEDAAAGQPPVHRTRQRIDGGELRNVGFAVENGLAQMRDGPALRNVEPEGFREFRRRFRRCGVAPRPEGHEEPPLRIESEVAVHHRGNADAPDALQPRAVPRKHLGRQLRVRRLHAQDRFLHGVGPVSVFPTAFPRVGALRNRIVGCIQQNQFDAG